MSQIIFTDNLRQAVSSSLEELNPASVVVYIDENLHVNPLAKFFAGFDKITAPGGEEGKTIENVCSIWQKLCDLGASRRSLLICIGGGCCSDAGGFAAATFKRGIPTVNIPTTLLAMVDASVGGKTAIDFNGLKNVVGVFHQPRQVIIDARWLSTLPSDEILSGYGEVLKTAMIDSRDFFLHILGMGEELIESPEMFKELLPRLVATKSKIVEADPHDHGLRHILNFGHTAGHAFESLAMKRGKPLPHGIAVAQGMMTEMILANMICGFDSRLLQLYASHFKTIFPPQPFTCNDYDDLIEIMRHDKKNTDAADISFSLPKAPGDFITRLTATPPQIKSALDITRDLLAI